MKYKCPCCGFYTFDEPHNRAVGDICPVCYWEIDPFVRSGDEESGANHGLSLTVCRENFRQFGACTESMAKYVRKPHEDELDGLDSLYGKRLKYFEMGIKGGCYNEFVKGRWDGRTHWSADHIYLNDDWFDELGLYENVFGKVFEVYNRWGPNRVTSGDWERLYALGKECGGEVTELFDELAPWAEENFAEYDEFWILGV